MAKFREVGGSKVYRTWPLWREDEYIVGRLVDTSIDNYGKTSYHVEIEEHNIEFDEEHGYTNKNGKFVNDTEIAEGETIALNHNGSLDYKLKDIEFGTKVKIVYEGQDTMKKGQYKGSKFHVVSVFVAEDESKPKSNAEKETEIDSFTQL